MIDMDWYIGESLIYQWFGITAHTSVRKQPGKDCVSDEMNLNVNTNLIVSQQVTAVGEEGSGDDRDELTRASYHALSLLDVPAIMVWATR